MKTLFADDAAPTSRRDQDRLEVVAGPVRFRSRDGRFTVLDARTREPRPRDLTVVGDLGDIRPGERLRLRGRLEHHPRHGARFRVDAFAPVLPETRDGLARYLGSGLVSGVGEALARRIVDRFGDETLEVIDRDSGRLTEVDGIGRKRAAALREALRARRREVETHAFLFGLGLGPALVRKVLDRYREDTVRVLRDDPYRLIEDLPGVGFRTADRLGRRAGIDDDDPRRARAGVLHALRGAADEAGHVYLPRPELDVRAGRLGLPPGAVDGALDGLTRDGLAVVEGGDDDPAAAGAPSRIYAEELHAAELEVADRLRALADTAPPGGAAHRRRLAQDRFAHLSTAQQEAVEATFRGRLVVITGGPGTGKTTTVEAIVAAHAAAGRSLLLCAPTGRASKRLGDAAGHPATTIHRALEWSPAARSFGRDAARPLDIDLVLVDEASMLDLGLARHLLRAIPRGTSLVLVGDVDQLPPVAPGPVLREVLRGQLGVVVRLHRIFRQAQASAIVRGAHAILEGHLPTPSPAGQPSPGDLHFVPAQGASIPGRVLDVLGRMARAYDIDPRREVQVLSPMRKGPAGTQALNRALRERLNPHADQTTAGPTGLARGDRVMQLVNDHDRAVFNGDLGEVLRVEAGTTWVQVDDREVPYEPEHLDGLGLAYAATVHKVQGSEFPAVVVVADRSHHVLLSRALLYTAVTRARRLVVLCGERTAFARAAANGASGRVHTRLAERLQRTSPD